PRVAGRLIRRRRLVLRLQPRPTRPAGAAARTDPRLAGGRRLASLGLRRLRPGGLDGQLARSAYLLLELPGGGQLAARTGCGIQNRAGRRRRLRGARRTGEVPVGARSGVTTILVTACGAPGAARLLRALKENGER